MNSATITLTGRIGSDPEKRQAGANTVVSFRMAVNKNRKAQNGERETMWFTVESWGDSKQSQNVLEYVKKGGEILVEGRFETNTYEKNGATNTALVVSLNNFQLPAREHGQGIVPKDAAPAQSATKPAAATTSAHAPAHEPDEENDEIPF